MYEGFRDLAPFLMALITLLGAIFAYRASERQKIKDAAAPAVVAQATGIAYAHDTAIRDLTEAITLLTTLVAKIASFLEKDIVKREREAELQEIIQALQAAGISQLKPRDGPPD
jgi:hypothetical protein